MGCQKVNWIPQNGKHGSVINAGINFMHSISGTCIQTFCSPSYQGQLYSPHTRVSFAEIYVSCQQDCSHWPSINPLISLVTHNILFPLYTFTIVFYTSCIPGLLWGSFINTYTQGWDLISLIYIYCIPSKPFFAISRQHPDAKSLLNDNTELKSIFY